MTIAETAHGFGSGPEPDPRTLSEPAAEQNVLPVVQRPRKGLSAPVVAGLAVLAGLCLFGVLEARRQTATAPAIAPTTGATSASVAPPPLYIPPPPQPLPFANTPSFGSVEPRVAVPPAPTPTSPPFTPPTVTQPDTSSFQNPSGFQTAPSPVSRPATPRSVSGQSLIVDTSGQSTPAETQDQTSDDGKTGSTRRASLSTTRARAAMLANKSTTVPQGTLISAVLETAFDSTSPGFARALVQKDVRGFDGTQILIPRGSRLIGEYGADTARGQARAVILWARLIRPDGVTIAIGSPAADTVGRGGVKADVNSHFLERFSGAILQSALDVGVNLAARSSRSPVIVALPGTTSAVSNAATARTTDITPTLRVPAGRSVSVFVARDLDFTSAGAVR